VLRGVISSVASTSEYHLAGLLEEIRNTAIEFDSSTDFKIIRKMVEEVDALDRAKMVAAAEFNHLANQASAAAANVELITRAIDSTKAILAQRFEINYAYCRSIANRAISEPVLREMIFERDGRKCLKCGGTEFLSVDHIVPVFRGGTNEPSNLQTLCISCNCKKGTKTA
jgi:hypothetical protein